MGTDDNGYELAICHQLGKAAKLRTGTRFSTDSSPDLGNTYALDFGDTKFRCARSLGRREDTLRAGETEQQMAVRHVAEQEKRIAKQEALIERLRKIGAPSDDALGLLAIMQDLLKTMRAHAERLSN
jgi:hypothetical protein